LTITNDDYSYYEILDYNLYKVYDIRFNLKAKNVVKFKDNFDITWNAEVIKVKNDYALLYFY
jgi:hypothetical protein